MNLTTSDLFKVLGGWALALLFLAAFLAVRNRRTIKPTTEQLADFEQGVHKLTEDTQNLFQGEFDVEFSSAYNGEYFIDVAEGRIDHLPAIFELSRNLELSLAELLRKASGSFEHEVAPGNEYAREISRFAVQLREMRVIDGVLESLLINYQTIVGLLGKKIRQYGPFQTTIDLTHTGERLLSLVRSKFNLIKHA